MKLNKRQILGLQKNKPPYLMVDQITKLIPGKVSEGYKNLPKNEWFFKVHWENNPNMPGALQLESMVQTCSMSIFALPRNKEDVIYFVEANNLKFQKKVVPGKKLILKTKITQLFRGIAICEGKGYQDKKLACEAKFKLVLPNELEKYRIKN